jgi:hypothetical protein
MEGSKILVWWDAVMAMILGLGEEEWLTLCRQFSLPLGAVEWGRRVAQSVAVIVGRVILY